MLAALGAVQVNYGMRWTIVTISDHEVLIIAWILFKVCIVFPNSELENCIIRLDIYSAIYPPIFNITKMPDWTFYYTEHDSKDGDQNLLGKLVGIIITLIPNIEFKLCRTASEMELYQNVISWWPDCTDDWQNLKRWLEGGSNIKTWLLKLAAIIIQQLCYQLMQSGHRF